MFSFSAYITMVLPTWTHFAVNVEWFRFAWFDDINSTVCLSFGKQLTAVPWQVWNTIKKIKMSA